MINPRLEQHRRAWSRKAGLRRVYRGFFQNVLDRCSDLRPIVELGCGAGFFHELFPHVVATDVEHTPWATGIVDACDMPFEDGAVGNFVLVDVFHHLPRPLVFLEQAARALQPGGRVVMLEPWTSALGHLFYKAIRHVNGEQSDSSVDPEHPFQDGKCPLDGNAALTRMFFGAKGTSRPIGHLPDRLNLVSVTKLPSIAWLLSGGFQNASALPNWLVPAARLIDRAATPFGGLIGLRALITLERPAEPVRVNGARAPSLLQERSAPASAVVATSCGLRATEDSHAHSLVAD